MHNHCSFYKQQCINILHFTNNTTETVCCKAAPSQSIHGTARRRRAPSPRRTCPSTQITQNNNQTIFTHTNTQQKPEKSIRELGPGGGGGESRELEPSASGCCSNESPASSGCAIEFSSMGGGGSVGGAEERREAKHLTAGGLGGLGGEVKECCVTRVLYL